MTTGWQEKLIDLMVDIETEKSAYNGKYIYPDDYKKIRDVIELKVIRKYPSDASAKEEYENLKDWYDKEFSYILEERKSKQTKSKSKRKICKCKK